MPLSAEFFRRQLKKLKESDGGFIEEIREFAAKADVEAVLKKHPLNGKEGTKAIAKVRKKFLVRGAELKKQAA